MTFALLMSVLVASLLGSLHCAAMCGPFVATWVVGEGRGSLRAKITARASYHLGRLFTYASLGAIAGALGAGVDRLGHMAGMTRLAAVVAGVLVLANGLGLVVPRLRFLRFDPHFLEPHAGKLVRLRTKSQAARAGLLGTLTPILPCGWLYAFVVTSAGTGGALTGASVMTAFWLGTVPALLGVDVVLAKLSVELRRRVPVLSGITLIVLGLFTIGRRLEIELPHANAAALSIAAPPSPHHSCH